MQIHELQEVGKKKKKRVARGGKRGTTAGRGTKGQKARSGGNVDPLFEGGRSSLTQRMKKLRGFSSPHAKKNVISLASLEKAYADGETVSLETLNEKGLIRKRNVKNGARIVGSGKCTKKLTVAEDVLMTETAAKALGGKATKKEQKPTKEEHKVARAKARAAKK